MDNPVQHERELTFADIVGTLARHYKIMVAVPLVATAVAAFFAYSMKPRYEARGNLEIGKILDKPIEEPLAAADRIESRPFLARIAKKLNLKKSTLQLADMVSVEVIYKQPEQRSDPMRMLPIRVASDDPVEARNIVEAIMEEIVRQHRPIYERNFKLNSDYLNNLRADIEKTRREIEDNRNKLAAIAASGAATQVEIAYLASYIEEKESYILHLKEEELKLSQQLYMDGYTTPTKIVLHPVIPDRPTGPHRLRFVVLAFGVSLVLAMVLAFFFERGSLRLGERPVLARPAPALTQSPPEEKKNQPFERVTSTQSPPIRSHRGERVTGGSPLSDSSFNLSELGAIFRRQWFIIAVVVGLGLAFSLIYGFVKPQRYRTELVVGVGIAGDTWLHNPLLTEEACRSLSFLSQLSARLGGKYSPHQLANMVEPELLLNPNKGLTRHVKITVTAATADDCYEVATKLGELIVEADRETYEKTMDIYERYLADLAKVTKDLAGNPEAVAAVGFTPNIVTIPMDQYDDTKDYAGGARLYPLTTTSTNYEENPFLISSVALLEQVYINTLIKTHSPIFSEPTKVVYPPYKPTKPEGHGLLVTLVIGGAVSLALGVTVAAISYRFQQYRSNNG